MKKHLQLVFLFIVFINSASLLAQNERTKATQLEVIPANVTTTKEADENNKLSSSNKETKKTIQPPVASQKSDANKTVEQIPAKLPKDQRKPKVIADVVEVPTDNIEQVQPLAPVNAEVNVTYTKEEIPANTTSNTVSETKKSKVQPSVNYQLKTVKADIHPVTDYSNAGISPNKKIYLQQEADDLQAEINQNSNNPSYDLAAKQKQLDDIKKLIQQ
jgi:hypothetical protein